MSRWQPHRGPTSSLSLPPTNPPEPPFRSSSITASAKTFTRPSSFTNPIPLRAASSTAPTQQHRTEPATILHQLLQVPIQAQLRHRFQSAFIGSSTVRFGDFHR
ncbi:hypothetical protein PIB30_080468, partial [Stylosanthes scabra]|nr:hypothetical protein [Stylosanthes scabra]